VTSRFLHGASVDEILAEENIAADGTRAVLWPLADQQGSVRDIARRGTDGRATTVDHIMYGPFGEKIAETDTAIAHLYGYTGREYDQETGLQYNRARYYDPKQGRFISQDPMSFDAGDANLYRMTGNHATYARDPSGLVRMHGSGSVRAESCPALCATESNGAHDPLPEAFDVCSCRPAFSKTQDESPIV
jgi:RHS repeat-associated protein